MGCLRRSGRDSWQKSNLGYVRAKKMQVEYIWAFKIIPRDQQRKKQIYPEMGILKKGRWSQQKPRKIITVIINVSGQGSPLEILLAIKNFSRVDFSFCEMCHCRWCLHYLHRWSWPARGLPLEPPTTPLLRSATPASKAWSWVFLSRILFILALPFPFGLVWTLCKLFWERVALFEDVGDLSPRMVHPFFDAEEVVGTSDHLTAATRSR